jgi:hypothetical protein
LYAETQSDALGIDGLSLFDGMAVAQKLRGNAVLFKFGRIADFPVDERSPDRIVHITQETFDIHKGKSFQ